MSTLYLITGPAGVGKSTISQKLAKKLEKSCLLEGDEIYHYVKSGYVSAWKPNNHLELAWKNNLDLINNSLEAGFDVVFNFIILKHNFERIKNAVVGHKIKFVVLLADEQTLLMRDGNRSKFNQMGDRCLVLRQQFLDEKFDTQYIFNTSQLTIKDCVDYILNQDRFFVK